MTTAVDHYERLAVARDAGPRQIARAFRRAARQAHPDAGGSADDFAAVAEAYRVLSDADLRAEYDRELDGAAADWDDVAWGAEVGGDAPVGGAADGAEGNDDDELWGDDDTCDGLSGDGRGADPFDPLQLDPFIGPPRRIPDPLAVGVAPRAPHPPRALETLAAVVAVLLGLTVLGLQAWAASSFDVIPAPGSSSSDAQVPNLIVWLLSTSLVVLLHAITDSRSRPAVGVWAATVLAFSTSVPLLPGPASPSGPLLASAAAAASTVVMGVTWARTYERRRHRPDRLAAFRQQELEWLLDRHHRAVEWNRVRAALLVPGATVVVVGAPATDLRGMLVPGRRWTFEPRSGSEAVRAVPGDVPRGSWLALDDEDRVVAMAPAGAPEAWLAALRSEAPQPAGRRAS